MQTLTHALAVCLKIDILLWRAQHRRQPPLRHGCVLGCTIPASHHATVSTLNPANLASGRHHCCSTRFKRQLSFFLHGVKPLSAHRPTLMLQLDAAGNTCHCARGNTCDCAAAQSACVSRPGGGGQKQVQIHMLVHSAAPASELDGPILCNLRAFGFKPVASIIESIDSHLGMRCCNQAG